MAHAGDRAMWGGGAQRAAPAWPFAFQVRFSLRRPPNPDLSHSQCHEVSWGDAPAQAALARGSSCALDPVDQWTRGGPPDLPEGTLSLSEYPSASGEISA